ncbi:MAG: transglycosylase SLT domain-containing protein [Desulfobacteraceae bacterium]|nr:transglycosylase SLT domain-containing protein [Desulfobacteraceae bacterium]
MIEKYRTIHPKTYLFIAAFLLLAAASTPATEHFPIFDELEPNVHFWKKVFTQYTTRQAIIHDADDLNIIYDVINLDDPDTPENKIINQQRVDTAKKKYRRILSLLLQKNNGETAETQRVATLFGEKTTRNRLSSAKANVRSQIGQSDRFLQGVIRSGAYLVTIKKILRNHGVPEDIAYLPHVESSFLPNAYSKLGATGMWQFTSATGRRFLKIDRYRDERLDPELSTRAAAAYLRENYDKLNDWPMAITAYNHGVGGMLRAKQKKGSFKNIFKSYNSRSFKFASRNFYAEFIAVRDIAKNIESYFGELKTAAPVPYHTWILPDNVMIGEISSHLKIPIVTLQMLNPALRSSVIKGSRAIPRNYGLRLPPRAKPFIDSYAAFTDNRIRTMAKKGGLYIVRKGDTAGKIARFHGITLASLIRANDLNPEATIYIDQKLTLPALVSRISSITEVSITGAVHHQKDRSLNRPAVYRSKNVAGLSHELHDAGNKRDEKAPGADPDMHARADHRPAYALNIVGEHDGLRLGRIQVMPEETLGHYTKWAKTDIRILHKLNGFTRQSVLKLHQDILIPIKKGGGDKFVFLRHAYHQNLQDTFFAQYRVENTIAYRVKPGDNVWRLAQIIFNVPLWLIDRYNPHVDLTQLKHSQKLMIPQVQRIV